MESMKTRKTFFVLFLFTFLCSFPLVPTKAQSRVRKIVRSAKHHLLASLPSSQETTQTPSSYPLLTSPSRNYAAVFLRSKNPIDGPENGSEFCYIQVQEGGQSVWQSRCTSVSATNACALVLSDAGLEIFDGNHSTWDTGADEEQLQTLELPDGGDMQIRDQNGKVVWKAGDSPLVNQNCGNTGNPETTSRRDQVNPPLGEYVGDPKQQSQQGLLNQQPLEGFTQPYASNSQPISDPSQPFNNHPISGTGQPFSATTSGPGLQVNNQPIPGTDQPFTNNQPIPGTGQPFTNLPFVKNTGGNNIPFLNEASQEKKLTLLVVLVSLLTSMAVLS